MAEVDFVDNLDDAKLGDFLVSDGVVRVLTKNGWRELRAALEEEWVAEVEGDS